MPARLTVDMFRLPNVMTPIEVKTRLVREGLRIRVIEADFLGGVAMARASCQLCAGRKIRMATFGRRRTGRCPRQPAYRADRTAAASMGGMWATRPISGGFGTVGERSCG